jgi:hypothetical protein
MAAQPQRRPDPKRFLDASLTPLERALLARAEVLEDMAARGDAVLAPAFSAIGTEFRALAEEMHYW